MPPASAPAPLIPSPEATRAANVVAAPNNGGAPPPVPVNPTTAQLNARNAAVGAPQTTTGAYTPTANASFPTPPSGSMKAPAVITADAATEHYTAIQNALKQAQSDIAAMRAHNAGKAQVEAPAANTPTPKTPASPPAPATLDEEISSILDKLNSDTKDAQDQKLPKDQQSVVDEDNSSIATDQEAITSVQPTIDSLTSGTYPLSQAEQAQVDSIKSQYVSALKAASDYAVAKGQGETAAVAASGLEEFSPDMAIGNIHAAITQGQQKVEALNTKIIDSQAKLQDAIEKDDYKTATALSKSLSDDVKQRSKEIGDINKTLATETKNLQTNAVNVAKLHISSLINSDKLSTTEKQQALSAASKQGNLDEKTRHDMQTELNAQKRLAKSPAGSSTKPDPNTVKKTEQWINATRGQDGYADPNAYKQAFDSWVSSGHAAKSFVANYPPKDFINPANDWLPKYLESKTSTKKTPDDVAAIIQKAFPTGGTLGTQ